MFSGRKIIAHTKNDLDDKILEIILERVMAISAISGMYFGLRELSDGLTAGEYVVRSSSWNIQTQRSMC